MTQHRRTLTALTAVGAVMALNSLALGLPTFLNSAPFSEIAGSASHLGYQAVLLGCVLVLNLALPKLAGLAGETGRTLPAGLLTFAAAAAFLDGGTRFVEAFVTPFLADHAPALLDESPASALMYAMVAAWVLWSIALVAVGVTAYRRRVFARPACVLLAVGGVAIPAIGPLSGVLIGSALAWAGAARLRTPRAADRDPRLVVA